MTRGALTLAFALAAGVASAQTQPSAAVNVADPSIEHALALREQGRDHEALAEFATVWTRSRSPEARAQMALASMALGRWVEAEQQLREALDATDHPWITARRSLLEGALAEMRQHLGRLEVMGNIAGAEVFLDGATLGRLPMSAPAWAREGTLVLEVRAEGYQPLQRRVVIAPGVLSRETVALVPAAQVEARVAPPAVVPRMTAATFEAARRPWRSLATSAFLAGGLTVAFGVFFSALRASASDVPRSEETWQSLAIGSFTTAGALLLVGVVAWWSMPAPSARDGVTLRCAPGVLGAGCALRF